MAIYLSEWERYDDGIDVGEAWRPKSGPGWVGGLIDLRGRTGRNLCVLEYDSPLPDPLPDGVHQVGDGWGDRLNPALSRKIESLAGRNRDALRNTTLREAVLALVGPSRTRRDGRSVVWCGRTRLRDEQTEEPRKNSVTYSESWPTDGDLTASNQDLNYLANDSDLEHWDISSGEVTATPPSNLTAIWNHRSDAADTNDMFASGVVEAFTTGASAAAHQCWFGCRGAESAATFYFAFADKDGNIRLRKSISGSRSDLTSSTSTTFPSTIGVEVEGDQITGTGDLSGHGPVTDTDITSGVRGYVGGFSNRIANTFTLGAWSFGDIDDGQELTGTLFQKAPTFAGGTVSPGAAALTGSLFTKAPTFGGGAITTVADLVGALFQKAPTFGGGEVSPGAAPLVGSVFQRAPTFGGGTVSTGDNQQLAGHILVRAPTFGGGTITPGSVSLAGTIFTRAPIFGEGAVAPGVIDLAGAVFVKAPTFGQGSLTYDQDIAGTVLAVAPTFGGGRVSLVVEHATGDVKTVLRSPRMGALRLRSPQRSP